MIIAFTGKKQTGKSTACKYLENNYNYALGNFKDGLVTELKQNFPDLLQAILDAENNYNKTTFIIDDLFQAKPPLVRTLMQNYGTQVRRNDDPNYWVRQWENNLFTGNILTSIPPQKEKLSRVTVDDCRFQNEAEAIKNNGGVIIRLERTDMVHTDTHVSETEMDSIVPDYTIVCEGGDEEHLYRELDRILQVR